MQHPIQIYSNFIRNKIIAAEILLRTETDRTNVSPMEIFDKKTRGRESGSNFRLSIIDRTDNTKKAESISITLDPLVLPSIKRRLDSFDQALFGATSGTDRHLPDEVQVFSSEACPVSVADAKDGRVRAAWLNVTYRFYDDLPWCIEIGTGTAAESPDINGFVVPGSFLLQKTNKISLMEYELPKIIDLAYEHYTAFITAESRKLAKRASDEMAGMAAQANQAGT